MVPHLICFQFFRCVCQGSVPSPILFLLVMDPLLIQLKPMSCGLNISGLDVGAFAHADDIRSLTTNLSDCQKQISIVKSNGFLLNAEECEAVISPSTPSTPSSLTSISTDEVTIPISTCRLVSGCPVDSKSLMLPLD